MWGSLSWEIKSFGDNVHTLVDIIHRTTIAVKIQQTGTMISWKSKRFSMVLPLMLWRGTHEKYEKFDSQKFEIKKRLGSKPRKLLVSSKTENFLDL